MASGDLLQCHGSSYSKMRSDVIVDTVILLHASIGSKEQSRAAEVHSELNTTVKIDVHPCHSVANRVQPSSKEFGVF